MIMPRLAVARILLFGVGNSGDGDGNGDIDRKKWCYCSCRARGWFCFGMSTKWLQRMRSPNRMSDISYVVDVNRL